MDIRQYAIQQAHTLGFQHAAFIPAHLLMDADIKMRCNGIASLLLLTRGYRLYSPAPPHAGRVSAYYLESHQAYLRAKQIAGMLCQKGYQAYVDTRLDAKHAVITAGIAKRCRNTLVASADMGSLFCIFIIASDIPADSAEIPMEIMSPVCQGCERCVQACPTGALDMGFTHSLCLRAYMLTGRPIPSAFREKIGERLLGCDICLESCPMNSQFKVRPYPQELSIQMELGHLLRGHGDKRWMDEHLGANMSRMNRWQSMAIIAAGNSGDRQWVQLLERYVADERFSIHAKWALARLLDE